MDNLLLFPDLHTPPEPQPPEPPPPPDAEARAQALDVHRSWIVEAPAGSGKTGLLMQRFLRLLALPDVEDPAHVLACTFTRKATGELRDRILTQLTNAQQNLPEKDAFERATRPFAQAVLERDRQLAWGLLDQPNRLNIRTLDSIANEIANSVPLLSGAGLSPMDYAAPLFDEAARRTILLLGTSDHDLSAALRDLLLHRDGNLANCESLIAEMLQHREQWAPLIPRQPAHLTETYLDHEVLPRFNRALDHVICRALSTLNEALPSEFLQKLCRLAAEIADSPDHSQPTSPVSPCAALQGPPAQTLENFRIWLALANLILTKGGTYRKADGINKSTFAFILDPNHKASLIEIIDSVRHDEDIAESLHQLRCLPPATYPPDQWRTAKSLFRVLAHALLELQTVFAATGRCDFSEPNLVAGAALRSEASLETLGSFAAVQHLLVDEMQDTSAAQYELLHLLTQRWDGFSQTVFLVGDPKQSIYLFRQARVERFVTTMANARLGSGPDAIPLGVLHLTANFRSRPQLVAKFNHDFGLVFPAHPDPANPDIVPYTAAHPTRSEDAAAGRTWHLHRFPDLPKEERTEPHRAQTRTFAREIRKLVEDWRSLPPPPGRTEWRIAVLVSFRTHLIEIIKAFNDDRHGPPIPYRANDIEQLRERQEILDLLALTRALLHPADRTAWLALLRTPWCGLTLVDLHLLAGQDDRSLRYCTVLELIEQRATLLSADAQARILPLHRVLAHALTRRGLLTPAQLVAETWHALGTPAFLSPAALTNAERFFTLLDELSTTGPLSIPTLTQRLEKLYAAASLQPDAVDLMTIHGAKGLEWDLVLVPSIERAGRNSTGRLLSWLELPPDPDEPSGSLTAGIVAPIFAKGDNRDTNTRRGHLADWILSVEKERTVAERKRLFYVACTRAREHLHLFASPKTKSDGTPELPENSLLFAAWPAASIPYSETPIADLPSEPIQTTTPLALAAGADPIPFPAPPSETIQTRHIHRIPLTHIVAPAASPAPLQATAQPFDRPEGSFAARVLGNTLHSLFEQLALRLASGTPAPALVTELSHWPPRIAALLRAGGLSPAEVANLTPTVLQSLRNTLTDPDGQWLIAPHPQASSEIAFNAADSEPSIRGIRLDRTFLAGPEPHRPGATHLWIVDWKTAPQGRRSREAFLARETEQYRPQLDEYARRLASIGLPIRLALYFPTLPALSWWSPE